MKNKSKKRIIFISILFVFLVLNTITFVLTYGKRETFFEGSPNYLNGVIANIVHIDDSVADYYYYKGQNFTHNPAGTLPSLEDKNYYPDSLLVQAEVTYSGKDINNNNRGYVSNTERQDTYIYNKVYPVVQEGPNYYIYVELIENPFTDRPTDMGFNGWVTDYNGVTIEHDNVYYLKTAKVPVTYTGAKTDRITITFNANWVTAKVGQITTNNANGWTNAFSPLSVAGMTQITTTTYVDGYYSMQGYFERVTIARYASLVGYYNQNGVLQTSGTCNTSGGCTNYYRLIGVENFNRSNTYYESRPAMTAVNNNNLPIPQIPQYDLGYTASSNMAGYFKQVTIPRYSSLEGYYDNLGTIQTSGTCNTTTGCAYYEYINYYDNLGNPNILDLDTTYYYLTTRDTNIVVMRIATSLAWTSNATKPFTLTTLHNGVKENYTWTTRTTIRAYTEINIENITMNSGTGYVTSAPATGTTTVRFLYANRFNIRIGRGIARSASNTSLTGIIGSWSGTVGSASNVEKYRIIVESGYYSTITLGFTTGSSNNYINARGLYGNDYDRVTNNNDSMVVNYVLAGMWGSTARSATVYDIGFDHTVKSGRYGISKLDNTTGIYIGGRNTGTFHVARRLKLEGGWVYNVIGGPMSDASRTNHNDVYFHMTGGEVDNVVGGGATTTTYGNRIHQITGGRINYSIFGGSNGSTGTNGDGQITGDSYIYIGGTSEIGDPVLVSNNSTIWGAEAGSVFGNGNGRSGTNYTDIGSLRNPNIIIADEAIINRNVYGGGNFGTSGRSGTTTTNIIMHGGTVKGSVYGGGNNNGAGKTNITATVNITAYDGVVEGEIYGGSNAVGTVYGSVNLDIQAGTFGSIYGGGRGGWTNTNNVGTYVRDNISIILGTSTTSPTILNSVYGGSAFGGVNSIAQNPSASTSGINILINNATINNGLFGGSQGSASFSPVVAGDVSITVHDGNINNIYGGNDINGRYLKNGVIVINNGDINNVFGGGNQVEGNNTNITVNDGTIGSVYGGGRLAAIDRSTVIVNGGTITNMYGGCEQANVTVNTNITVNNGAITTIYGGSNQSGNIPASFVEIINGNIGSVYGGNNAGGLTTTTDVRVQGGTLTYVYGGGKLASIGTSNILINAGTIGSVFGGSEQAGVTASTNITTNGSTITNLFGGSNVSGNIPTSNININTGNIGTIYGGNNIGGKTSITNITASGGTAANIYGGGKLAASDRTNLILSGITATNVFGGGDEADVTIDTRINVSGGNITTMYGGSNLVGNIPSSQINVTNGTIGSMFGGNNAGGQTTSTQLNITNGTFTNIYGGGREANTVSTEINFNNSLNKVTNVFGGGQSADATTTVINVRGGSIDHLYGGSNQSGIVSNSTITVTKPGSSTPSIDILYGGNNAGGQNINTIIDVTNANLGGIYGGADAANVSGNTTIHLKTSTVSGDIFGGGNNGEVGGSTNVRITSSSIGGSVHAGGNGSTATVFGNTNLDIEGQTVITGHVFGGGNAASTGSAALNNSQGSLNIAGGTINGSVYGGANTAVLYGETVVNIGLISGLILEDIVISGTVFGGGEANASGSEEYDYSFISVTNGITINIDGSTNKVLNIQGSIFGSGNASSTTGYSNIMIKKYGSASFPIKNISVQRADLVTLDNAFIELVGATDRTNEYSTTLFTFSRVKNLKLMNNSMIYLETGANLLEKIQSLVTIGGVEVKGAVTIDEETGVVTKNVDNRVYIKEGKNLNIATNEAVTSYGDVYGMFFFGMYSIDRFGNVDEAFFSPGYNKGDEVLPGEFYHFSSGSYVLGRHLLNHDIEIDGFYSNYEDEENEGIIDVRYVLPTPESSNFYMWTIGESITSYDIELAASKYSTLGTYELPLMNFPNPNTRFTILGVNYNDLTSDFELVRQHEIPRISTDGTADTKMSLVMKASNTGWMTVGETTFVSDEYNPIYGTEEYIKENSHIVPTWLFYIYHSKNLETSGSIGSIIVSLIAVTPIDDLSNEVERINLNIELSRVLYTTLDYEGAMTAGEEHDMFVSTQTDITSKSKLSTYYSLYTTSDVQFYKTGYHRSLVSSYSLPENTKITMVDLSTNVPEYYYYVITNADYLAGLAEIGTHGESSLRIDKFIKMGSSSSGNNYKDNIKNNIYHDTITGIVHEEFVFIVDFADTNMTADQTDSSLLFELRDNNEQTIISVLGIQHGLLTYNVYSDNDAVIELNVTSDKETIYIGDEVHLNILTNFLQKTVLSRIIYDTTFHNQKLGLKLSILDSDNNQVNGAALFGIAFRYNGIRYYPQMDGSVRINIAPKIANVLAKIDILTENTSIASGDYKIKIESFGSPDGIYFGHTSSDQALFDIGILNSIYGLKSTIDDDSVIVDKVTGTTNSGSNTLTYNIEYASGVGNPNLRVSLRRRLYDEIYENNYENVDLKDYSDIIYGKIGLEENYEYLITNNPSENEQVIIELNEGLMSGTYQVVFSLYDNNAFIGEVFNYLIIK